MKPTRALALLPLGLALAAISGCSPTARVPSPYDSRVSQAVREAPYDRCRASAYETGRQRFEQLEQFQGTGFSTFLANRAADRRLERCRTVRG